MIVIDITKRQSEDYIEPTALANSGIADKEHEKEVLKELKKEKKTKKKIVEELF